VSTPGDVAFLGLDLAWSRVNPSGVAALDGAGRVLEVRADLVSDDALLAWIRTNLRSTTALGFDMPTIVRNPGGARPCERELAATFRAAHAGPHPANLARFPGGGRARALLDALAADGVVERLDVGPREDGRFAFEVFPHPALVRLFGLERIFKYKKKNRRWPDVLAAWATYRAALATLVTADPPLVLGDLVPATVEARGYKRWDDGLDAVTCAYVAAFAWRHGTLGPEVRVFGDLRDGYVVVPDRLAILPPGSSAA